MELVKLPGPEPSAVFLSAVVGLGLMLQQTPRAVTAAPPSELTSPPDNAEVSVILLTDAMVTVGITFTVSFLQLNMSDRNNTAKRTENMSDTNNNFFIIKFGLLNV
jgi:hypothetical protein